MACDVKQFTIARAARKPQPGTVTLFYYCRLSTWSLNESFHLNYISNFIDSDQTGESQQPPKERVQLSRQAGAHATDTGFLSLCPAITP